MALLSSLRKLLSGSGDTKSTGGASATGGTSKGAAATPASAQPAGAPIAPVLSPVSSHSQGPGMMSTQTAVYTGGDIVFPSLDASPEWLHFSTRLFGLSRLKDVPPSSGEQGLMQRLQAQRGSQWADLLPRLPAVLPQLMRLVRRGNVSSSELAQLMSRDPSLVGELMRLANSPRYRTEREITDLAGAVMVLGQQGLDQLVMSVAMRPLFHHGKGRYGSRSGTLLWDLSERTAFATARLANAGDDEFSAYLAGLSSQLGLMALLRALDGMSAPSVPPLDREGLHRQLLPLTAAWSAQIVEHWGFPPQVAEALAPRPGRGAESIVLAHLVRQAQAVALRQLMQPGLQPAQLGDWSAAQQRCYADLEREFNAGAS
ncbi:HDOD domain-containing protein [Roseateles sp. L2-2]|uniref:HDOD domain-containing protein n=1 Tax=Roseateles TaxID=93681 RepID=UPI003D36F319